jgi:lipopolysaccharide transport system ATP-binding protein
MSDIVIRVDNLSKKYVLGKNGSSQGLLRHVIHDVATAPVRWLKNRAGQPEPEAGLPGHAYQAGKDFWALKDVCFEVKQGEVMGVIGRNGAGKSTLLKILSRITEQTEGRAEITGRVASLLEVGTGFHPELTGRENVFLNGAILGMSRAEIRKKFDEIVAFAEVEKFLDTPVKRYSSGMYVRLAFAVAAHLEPEILIVDEVLAVGDAEFQKKCLGKMQDVSKSGRTVLFVSHNLDSIIRLCSSALWLDGGRVSASGSARDIINHYQQQQRTLSEAVDLDTASRPHPLFNHARFIQIKSRPADGQSPWNYGFNDGLAFDFTIKTSRTLAKLSIAFAVFSSTGFEIASTRSHLHNAGKTIEPGSYHITIKVRDFRLAPGTYKLNLGLRSEFGDEDFIPDGPFFEVSTDEKAAALFVDTIRAACIPHSDASLFKL